MKIDLKKYYDERERINRQTSSDGPVITISREYGCEANRIARVLVGRLNERPAGPMKRQLWKYLNKEILEESGKVLGLRGEQVEQRIQNHDSDPFSALFSSLGQHYDISDHKIIDTVSERMLAYAKKGNVIMVGRGGSVITGDMNNILRIRLVAPFEWRAAMLSSKMNISQKDAEKLAIKMDANRKSWVEHLSGKKYNASVYDLIINVKSLSDQEIVQMILQLMESRGYINPASKQESMKKEFLKV